MLNFFLHKTLAITLSFSIILSQIPRSRCAYDFAKNLKTLKNLQDDKDKTLPLSMSIIDNEFVMLLNTGHIYRAPESTIVTSDKPFKIELDPRRLIDIRDIPRGKALIEDIGKHEGSIVISKTNGEVWIGVIHKSDRCLSSYRLRDLAPVETCEKYDEDDYPIPFYRSNLWAPKIFTTMVITGDKKKSLIQMTHNGNSPVTPQNYELLSSQNTDSSQAVQLFGFFYISSEFVILQRDANSKHFQTYVFPRKITDGRSNDYTNKDGIPTTQYGAEFFAEARAHKNPIPLKSLLTILENPENKNQITTDDSNAWNGQIEYEKYEKSHMKQYVIFGIVLGIIVGILLVIMRRQRKQFHTSRSVSRPFSPIVVPKIDRSKTCPPKLVTLKDLRLAGESTTGSSVFELNPRPGDASTASNALKNIQKNPQVAETTTNSTVSKVNVVDKISKTSKKKKKTTLKVKG